jgi:hypothetical protein
MTRSIEQQSEKHDLQRISTERGITIDFNDEQRSNADSSIRVKEDPDSNLTTASELQFRQHCSQSRSIDRAISISASSPNSRSKHFPSKVKSC